MRPPSSSEIVIAPVAQLDRASDYGSEGWEFESLRARTKKMHVGRWSPSGTSAGRGAARLARLVRDQEVGGSNPLAPTMTKGAPSSLDRKSTRLNSSHPSIS